MIYEIKIIHTLKFVFESKEKEILLKTFQEHVQFETLQFSDRLVKLSWLMQQYLNWI